MLPVNTTPETIASDELYSLDELNRRLKLGPGAMRTARRQGLKVHRFGRRGFVLGRDIIEFVTRPTEA